MVPPLDPLTTSLREQVLRLGFDLVDVRIAGAPSRRSVRVRIDRPASQPGAGVSSDDCAQVSKALLGWFGEGWPGQVVDTLEVSSPGLERPVVWPEHWRRFAGQRVRVRTKAPSGRLVAVIQSVPDDEHVVLDVEGQGERTIALADITEATLVVDWSKIR
jgi:ribosome maturation factor RimP